MEFYTTKEIAALMHLRLNRIYELIALGMLPGVHVGKRVLVPRVAWEQWCNARLAESLANVKTTAKVAQEKVGA